MRPFSTPVTKERVLQIIESVMTQSDAAAPLHAHSDFVHAAITRLFERCPDVFQDKKFLSNGVSFYTPDTLRAISEKTGIDLNFLQSLRRRVCAEASLVFYAEYFEKCLAERMIPFCSLNKPPKKWGLGSVFYWHDGDEYWGRAFYACWRQQIEKTGDEIFRAKILPRLPQEWRDAYELVPRTKKCPYDWKKMSPEEIARVLIALRKKKDPAQTPWWFGIMANEWTGEADELWGKSFWSYWRDHIEARGDAVFRRAILQLLPGNWQENFMESNLSCREHSWADMPDAEIGCALGNLKRPFGLKKWGLGSARHWKGSQDSLCGSHFVDFWRKNCEPNGDKIFRARILPHIPEPLRNYYRMVGYEIEFSPTTAEMEAEAQTTEDMDKLYALAQAGNCAAFKKLTDFLQSFLQEERNIVVLPRMVVERIVHMHLPVYGSILKYAKVSGYLFCKNTFQFDDRRSTRDVAHAREELEEQLVVQIDAGRILNGIFDFLAGEGVSSSVIRFFVDIFIDAEVSLADLAAGKIPEDFDDTQISEMIHIAELIQQFVNRQT
ncbi:hypothetical protein HYW83_01695 [Candidatus Peregrinibacteria bacterium]|nr:hypothetical protein [Candidatus Peregrinibacteria bacterium]